eukprot:1132942-Rhodomonas_salina.1
MSGRHDTHRRGGVMERSSRAGRRKLRSSRRHLGRRGAPETDISYKKPHSFGELVHCKGRLLHLSSACTRLAHPLQAPSATGRACVFDFAACGRQKRVTGRTVLYCKLFDCVGKAARGCPVHYDSRC